MSYVCSLGVSFVLGAPKNYSTEKKEKQNHIMVLRFIAG